VTTPDHPAPEDVLRWAARLRWARRLDAALAWLLLWGAVTWLAAGRAARVTAAVAVGLTALGVAVRPLRARWRPLSGLLGLAVSRHVRPGDRVWFVRGRVADIALVTARHGARSTISMPGLASGEDLDVRRTRVLLLPADTSGSP